MATPNEPHHPPIDPVATALDDYARSLNARSSTERLWTIEEVAKYLSFHPGTVRRWIASGDLTADRVGPRAVRIRHQDLLTMLSPAQPS